MTRAAVPDALLAPLLDAAAEVLRDLPAADVPAALRPLAGFDRRGLANATARQQLRRAFDHDAGFRAAVAAAFCARPEVRVVLDGWDPARAAESAADAADRDDLPWWASAIYAAEPDGADFGLGVACSEDRNRRSARTLLDDARAGAARLVTAEEARRRAEAALAEVRAELARADGDLRDERRGRREREEGADRVAEEAARAVREAEAALDRSRRDGELAEARARRESERAREAERRLRERSRDVAPPAVSPGGAANATALADAARTARELTARLEALSAAALSAAARPPAPAPPVPASPPAPPRTEPAVSSRRASAPCPPGRRAEEPEAVEAMLRAPGLVLLVDGYNVSMSGWPGVAVAQQRDQLVSALVRLHLRVRSHAVVVFDGADVEGVPPRRTPGVRVVFSPAGRAADPVIIEHLRDLPTRVPVLVASSDGWVRDEARRDGATVIPADALLAVLRR
ncbi:MAG: NYN domain-containing protein [Acidimicrobiia bacterium]|jgi:predicted RNA-binding protein with PIN domain